VPTREEGMGQPHRPSGPWPVPRGRACRHLHRHLVDDLGISKAAIYCDYRSKDALLHHLIDPLRDATDACIQNPQLQSLLAALDARVPASLRAEAVLGAIWRPLIAQPQVDRADPAHQQPRRPSPDGDDVARWS
jgi:AcrR family transcriptional regulator